eukprot:scaffold620_cov169-Amphora_coffeaeformis.AAC.16
MYLGTTVVRLSTNDNCGLKESTDANQVMFRSAPQRETIPNTKAMQRQTATQVGGAIEDPVAFVTSRNHMRNSRHTTGLPVQLSWGKFLQCCWCERMLHMPVGIVDDRRSRARVKMTCAIYSASNFRSFNPILLQQLVGEKSSEVVNHHPNIYTAVTDQFLQLTRVVGIWQPPLSSV